MSRDRWLRLSIVLAVGILLLTFYLTGLHERFRWDYVRAHVEHWQRLSADYLLLSLFTFFLVYVSATALSLPVALILSLIGGALFGRWLGVAVVSLGSTTGACLAFLASRYLFRDLVRQRFGTRLAIIDHGIARDGAWFLLTLRMAPYVPFFLINLGMGLTPMRLSTFAGVSWVGMLPATFVIVNAGTEIGRLEQPSDALSPTFLASLALLGLFPLLLRLGFRRLSRRGSSSESAPPG